MFGTDWDIEDEALDGLEQGARSPALRIEASEGRYPMAVAGAPVQQAPVLPIYPLPAGIGQAAPPPPAPEPFLSRKMMGVPTWAWLLVGSGAGVGGYLYWKKSQKVERNEGGSSESPDSAPSSDAESGSWSPSRSKFGQQVQSFLSKKGMGDKVTVYTDADEAKAKLKTVSPLITLKCAVRMPITDLDKMCRREGLMCVEHEEGVVGLYPTTSKRGKQWEQYIDALRDDGQTV